jgi:hypothetical protein
MLLRTLGLPALLLVSGLALQAGEVFYAVSFDIPTGVFGTLDPFTGSFSQIGPALPGHAHDVTVSPDGTVYAVVDSNLVTIDKSTGVAALIGALPANLQSLAFRSDSTLFGASFADLYTVDPSTAAGTLIGSLGVGTAADNIRFGAGNTLYLMSAESNSALYTVNTTTGATTLVGQSGVDDTSLGAFLGGTFYGTNQIGGTESHIVSIDSSTGLGTEGALTDDIYLFALDPTSVPEPGTVLLCAAGIGALLLRRRFTAAE